MIAGVLPSESKHRADALRSITLATLTMRASKQYRFHASIGSTLAISVAHPCSSQAGCDAAAALNNGSLGVALIEIATNWLLLGLLKVEATHVGERSLDLTI